MNREVSVRGGKFTLGAMYAAAALIVAGVSAIALFPYQALEQRMEAALQERAGVDLSLSGTGFSPPLGLGADRAIVRHAFRDLAFEITGIDVQWRPWALFSGEQRFSGQASSCGGRIQAVARFGSLLLRDSGAVSLELKDVSLKECAATLQLEPVTGVSGRLQGEAEVHNVREGVRGINGNASFRVDEARVGFSRGPLRGLAVKEVRFRASLRKQGRTLRLTEARLDSPGIEASLSGRMRLEEELEKSRLDLRMELELHPGRLAAQPENAMVRQALSRKGMELILEGTAGSPRVRMQ